MQAHVGLHKAFRRLYRDCQRLFVRVVLGFVMAGYTFHGRCVRTICLQSLVQRFGFAVSVLGFGH